MNMNLMDQLNESTAYVRKKSSLIPRVGITLGSGLSAFANEIHVEARIPFSEIPHFSPPTVEGHPGDLILGTVESCPVAILQGRIHFYEGHSMDRVVYPTRLLGFLGAKTILLTNAAGGLSKQMSPGDLMIIENHINLTGTNPLIGHNIDQLGPRFPDMSELYDLKLISQLEQSFESLKIPFHKGVYCGVTGPSYETAAEIQYLQKIGGSTVGMSTVAEAIVARHMGLKVCGISCITNLGTGLTSQALSHEEVKEVGQLSSQKFISVLKSFLSSL